jgi:peptide/nickel transport system permease protein
VLIGVTLISYLLIYLLNVKTDGGLARSILGGRATPSAIRQFDDAHHLHDSFWVQYWDFLKQLVHGNLGFSYDFSRSTTSLIGIELPRDLVLGIPALIISLIIAVPLGIAQAVKRNSTMDYVGTGVSFFFYSIPTYAVALILVQVFSLWIHAAPAVAPASASWSTLLTHPSDIVLPVVALIVANYALFSRYMRSSALDTLAQDYIRTARAKGLSEYKVLRRHLLRNSLLTIITLIGLSIPTLITGALIVEYMFNIPGIGLEYLTAAQNNDFEVMLGLTVVIGFATILGNFMADIAYAFLDPRVRY